MACKWPNCANNPSQTIYPYRALAYLFFLFSFSSFSTSFFKDFIYLFLETGKGRRKRREKHQCVVASGVPPTGHLACNPGMWPNWELNQRSSVSQPALNPLSFPSQGSTSYFKRGVKIGGSGKGEEKRHI